MSSRRTACSRPQPAPSWPIRSPFPRADRGHAHLPGRPDQATTELKPPIYERHAHSSYRSHSSFPNFIGNAIAEAILLRSVAAPVRAWSTPRDVSYGGGYRSARIKFREEQVLRTAVTFQIKFGNEGGYFFGVTTSSNFCTTRKMSWD